MEDIIMNTLQNQIESMAKAIKTDNYPMSIGELASLYQDGDLNIQPLYQRLFRWNMNQQSNLIESILLNIPIPPIYVYQNEEGKWELIDGLQRVSTLLKFMGLLKLEDEGKLTRVSPEPLTKTKFLPALEGKYWNTDDLNDSLTEAQRRYIKRSKISIVIIDKSSDKFAQYEMFRRLNTGGSLLSAQEIRNCMMIMANEDVYDYFSRLSQDKNLRKAVPLSEKNQMEQGYLELVVKCFVFRYSNMDVNDSDNYNDFLTDEIVRIMNEAHDFKIDCEMLVKLFALVARQLGGGAFKRYNQEKDRSSGTVLMGALEAIIPGVFENLKYYLDNPELLKPLIHKIYSNDIFLQAMGRGIRPVTRMKSLVKLSKEYFKPCQKGQRL